MKQFFRSLVAALALLAGVAAAQTPNTTLTGTILSPGGTPVNGNLFLQLSQTANVLSTGGCGGPLILAASPPYIFSLTNGSISGPGVAPFKVYGADCLSPSGLTYHMTATGPGGAIVVELDVSISGASVNLGTLAPVTPSPTVPSGLAGDVTGPASQTRVVRLQGRNLLSTAPTTGQVIGWDGAAWGPSNMGGLATGFTLGSVVFTGVAGVLAQDNANYFWDDTTNRLGINTAATPLYPLDVRGTVGSTAVAAFGISGLLTATAADGVAQRNGIWGSAHATGAGTHADLRGTEGNVQAYTGAAAVTNASSLRATGLVNGPASFVNRYGLYIEDLSGGGAVTNQYGIYIPSLTRGGTLNTPIFSAGSGTSTFGGILESTSGGFKFPDATIQTTAATSVAAVADDTTTNALMFPVWSASASGALAPKVSSTQMTFNPGTNKFNLSGSFSAENIQYDGVSAWSSNSFLATASSGFGGYTFRDIVSRDLPAVSAFNVTERVYGADPTGAADSKAAINLAIAAAAAAGGGVVYFPPGQYRVVQTGATVPFVITAGNTIIRGAGRTASRISFEPATGGAVFQFNNGAVPINYNGIQDISFSSPDTTTQKTMVMAYDLNNFFVERISNTAGTSWTGATSIGVHFKGRQELRMRNCEISADQPVKIDLNPNHTINFDHSSIESSDLLVTLGQHNPSILIVDDSMISNAAFEKIAAVQGNGAIFFNNTTQATASQTIVIDNIRSEQSDTSGGHTTEYCIDIRSSAGQIQGLGISNVQCDGALHGIRLTNAKWPLLRGITYGGTATSCGGGVCTFLDFSASVQGATLIDSFKQSGSIITDASSVPSTISYVNGGNPPVTGFGTLSPTTAVQVVGTLTATAFAGPLTGNVTGNASGTAATVTGAAQTAITSVGTLNGVAVTGNGLTFAGTGPSVVGTNAGSTGTYTMGAGSTDKAGVIIITTGGAGIGSAGSATLTFGTAFTGANRPIVFCTLSGSATANWNAGASCQANLPSNTGTPISWNHGGTLTSGVEYWIDYLIISK
jgi:hypothetical protein